MSASSLRRLPLCVLVATLAFPAHAFAAPWNFGDWVGRVRGLLSMLWTLHGCEIDPNGRCETILNRRPVSGDSGCEINPDGRLAPTPSAVGGGSLLVGDSGC